MDRKFAVDVLKFAALQLALFYTVKYVLELLDPMKRSRDSSKAKSKERIKGLNKEKIVLNEHEEIIATELIMADELKVSFENIGGMEDVVENVKQAVLYPLQFPGIFSGSSGLLSPPRGVLLYGPPGCGKTMLAKAIAKESGASFINLRISTLTEKWFGESQKLVKAVFTLARKIQPTIIFIDEIDSFLRSRQSNDHEVTAMMKAEFMSLWDGLTTDEDVRIVILGATNRPLDIDQAILRRMPKKFHISLPNQVQRVSVLQLTLKNVKLEPDFPYEEIAKQTEGLSGSDLKEICREAVMAPIQEHMASLKGNLSSLQGATKDEINLRPVSAADFYKQEGFKNPKRRHETPNPILVDSLD